MNKRIDPFTVLLPHLDLHGEDKATAKFLIETFLKDNYLMGNERLVIIHGKSTGILKKETQEVLKISKLVKNYYIDAINDGQTIVEIIKKPNR